MAIIREQGADVSDDERSCVCADNANLRDNLRPQRHQGDQVLEIVAVERVTSAPIVVRGPFQAKECWRRRDTLQPPDRSPCQRRWARHCS